MTIEKKTEIHRYLDQTKVTKEELIGLKDILLILPKTLDSCDINILKFGNRIDATMFHPYNQAYIIGAVVTIGMDRIL